MRLLLICCYLFLSPFAKAQKISEAYLQAQKDFGLVQHRDFVAKLSTQKDTTKEFSFRNNRAKNQTERLKSLLIDYQLKTGKNLENASTLYFLEENAISANSSITIIWTKKDTIFNKVDLIKRFNDTNHLHTKASEFNASQNTQKDYFIVLMNLISKTKKVNLTEEIKKRVTPIENYLDGANYILYIFKKKGKHYLISEYTFTNLEFSPSN